MTSAADEALSVVDSPLDPGRRRIVALFSTKVVQEQANGFQFVRDDGVRLDVLSMTELEVFDAGPPSWPERPPVR
jgi:hypothetical protein